MNLPRKSRLLVPVTLAALAVTGISPLVAAAAENAWNVTERTPSMVTADALPTTQIDGIAWDQVIVGNTVYVGGEFANARPAGAAPGTNLVPRSNLLAYDITTGVLKPGFAPVVNGKVKTLTASPDGRKLYIGGSFTTVNGQPRNRIAAINLADGSLDKAFAPSANNSVDAIHVGTETVWFGGTFSTVDGQPRGRLAAATTGGQLTGWAPTADLYVSGMTLTPDGSKLAVGGTFNTINGTDSPGLAFLDPATGVLHPFAANQVVQNHGTSSGIYSLKSDGKNLLATGWWFGGVGNFEGVLSASPTDGSIRWMADCHGDSYDATTMSDVTYSVSHHHFCSNIGSFPEQTPQYFERAQAFTDKATTTVRHDTANYHDFYGQPAPTQMAWNPELAAGNVSGAWQAAWTAESNDTYLVLGGEFPKVNRVGQQGLVRFAVPGTAPSKTGPSFTWDWTPTTTVVGTSVKLGWPSNVDPDNMRLTYRVYRDDRPATPLATLSGDSRWWTRPAMGHLDTGLQPGRTYTYWVTATDPDGNVASSVRVKATAGTTATPTTPYSEAVSTDGASHYWRLLEPAGSPTSIDWRSQADMALAPGVQLGRDGAVAGDGAARFDGTANGHGASGNPEAAPAVFSTELWFRTTTTTGGKLIGFGDRATGYSGSYDRHVYMDTAGRLHFGVYPGSAKVVSSSRPYNDGEWHHMVASLSSAGQQLWVDGRLVGGDAGSTAAEMDYRGHWRVGGDAVAGWPGSEGTGNDFAGDLDEVAVYPTALTRDQIRNHYTLSGRELGLPAAPADDYGKAVEADNPVLHWRLDEDGGTVAHDATDNLFDGVIAGRPAYDVPSTVTGAQGTAMGFDGQGAQIGSEVSFTAPKVFSTEAWINTTSTTGGKVMGFGNQRNDLSWAYDRHVWLDQTGHAHFGVHNGSAVSIDSDAPLNDGRWHHLVATLGSQGMSFWVDGVLQGTNPNTGADDYIGYWRVGGDRSWSGDEWFDGSIDEAAVYGQALSQAQVRAHYRASGADANQAPRPSFTVSCEGERCTFDASASSDPDGLVNSLTWDFGDGTKATGAKVTRTYPRSGRYDAVLTATDDQELSASTTRQVDVAVPNKAPVAAIQASCTELACSFDSGDSTDPDGTIAAVAWDFGDGTSSTEAAPRHSYAAPGSYTVALTVTDDAGATHRTTRTVTVGHGNALPVASFTSAVDDLAVAVDGSASTDPDGTITGWAWDFGDGSTATGATARHTYTKPGRYTVTLTVTDDAGASSQRTAQVNVTEPANQPPTARFTVAVDGSTVALDASGSTDPDGSIASVAWDFGDGTTGEGVRQSHDYPTAGSYTVTVTVTDDQGESASTKQAITIAPRANQAPAASFTQTVTDLTAAFDASASSDPDGTITGYAWDFGDGTTGSGSTARHAYAAPGSYTVTLVVTDDAGATHRTSHTVEVSAPAPVVQPVAADDFATSRTRWGSATTGGAWSYPVSPSSFSTADGQGRISVGAGGTAKALLPSAVVLDSTTTADLSVDRMTTGGGLYASLVAREKDSSNYMMGVRLTSSGAMSIVMYRSVNGQAVVLKDTPVAGALYKPGSVVHASFQVSGQPTTTLRGMIWVDGQPRPAAPQVTLTDATAALQRAGSPGVNAYLSGSATNGPVLLTLDNLLVTKDLP
ncbi:PKD domain-containing protein [Luteococcus peritonei]|uniref:PKD domain-containing protein n=1 Tax=Luteococcus peritonei TaxID=88874 RepID=A0ABW4RT14_9ACTN